MARTEMAKSYEGLVTVRPITVERLQAVAELVENLNRETTKKAMTKEYQAEIEAASKSRKNSAERIAEIESTRDRRIAQRCESIVQTIWSVDYSDESTVDGMSANEVMGLSNLDSRQLNGVRVVSSGPSEFGGLRFRFDTRKHAGLSRISIVVAGQENDVQIVFGKLHEIAKSSLTPALIRGSFLKLYIGGGVFLVLLELSFLLVWKKAGHSVSETHVTVLLNLMLVSLIFGGNLLEFCAGRLYPSWNCTIGDGDARVQNSVTLRQNWLQLGFGGVILAIVVSFFTSILFPD